MTDSTSSSPDAKEQDSQTTKANPKTKRIMTILGILILIAICVWAVHWFLVGRFHQETNNAYLRADSVAIAPRVNGYVTEVLVKDNQWVVKGQPLLRIDARDYKAKLEQALAAVQLREADIAAAKSQMLVSQSNIDSAKAQVKSSSASLRFAKSEVHRVEPLVKTGADTHEHLESLQQQLDGAQAQYDAALAQQSGATAQNKQAQAQLAQAKAGLRQAKADAENAQLLLNDTELTARISGRIGDKTVQVGQFLAAGTRTMTIVPLQDLYLVANYKETQVGRMRPGQPATIRVDALPDKKIKGTVERIAPGTGSEFALLPADNATGNFTKIVQRVPVRIHIDADEETRNFLVPGLSVEVTVNTLAKGNDSQDISAAIKASSEADSQ